MSFNKNSMNHLSTNKIKAKDELLEIINRLKLVKTSNTVFREVSTGFDAKTMTLEKIQIISNHFIKLGFWCDVVAGFDTIIVTIGW